jgi:hypothetical protein
MEDEAGTDIQWSPVSEAILLNSCSGSFVAHAAPERQKNKRFGFQNVDLFSYFIFASPGS